MCDLRLCFGESVVYGGRAMVVVVVIVTFLRRLLEQCVDLSFSS